MTGEETKDVLEHTEYLYLGNTPMGLISKSNQMLILEMLRESSYIHPESGFRICSFWILD